MSFTIFFLIAGGVVLVGIVAVIVFFVSCAILTAWEYAKSPRAQMRKELGYKDERRMVWIVLSRQ